MATEPCAPFWTGFYQTTEQLGLCEVGGSFIAALRADFEYVLVVDATTGEEKDFTSIFNYSGWEESSPIDVVASNNSGVATASGILPSGDKSSWYLVDPTNKTAFHSPASTYNYPSSNSSGVQLFDNANELLGQTETSGFSATPDDVLVSDVETGTELWRQYIGGLYTGWKVGSNIPSLSPDGTVLGVILEDDAGEFRVVFFDALTGDVISTGPAEGSFSTSIESLTIAQDSDGGSTVAGYYGGNNGFAVIEISSGSVLRTISSAVNSASRQFPLGGGVVGSVENLNSDIILLVRDLHGGTESSYIILDENVSNIRGGFGAAAEGAPILTLYETSDTGDVHLLSMSKDGGLLYDLKLADQYPSIGTPAATTIMSVLGA